jgi:U4/U6 small nuclear ribonucleoprotein PRP3
VIEWWDQGLTTNSTYADIDIGALKINTEDTIVTLYIQHPIQIEPPQDKHIPPPKPLPLTKKEQKKVRRQRRAEELKEKQAKVRLGLEPPPPPKIKKSNMMRVLGEEAVKDPTAVEARVNKEIRERLEKHLQTNEERKLTKEQRAEKILQNQEKDVAKGIQCLVFRIETLANGRHRFKINKNADQLGLTGICIYSPKFNLVIVEGGPYAINKYKKLMMQRIDWQEDVDPLDPEENNGEKVTHGADIPMASNRCTLVWEGELKQKGFRKFSSERCPTDAMAKERLERGRMEYMWQQAKDAVKNLEQ